MARPTPGICAAHCPHCHGVFPVALAELTADFERDCPACGETITCRRPSIVPTAAERAWLDRMAMESPAPDLAVSLLSIAAPARQLAYAA